LVALSWPDPQQKRFAELQASGAKLAYWRSDAEGRPSNGGKGEPVKPGTVHEEEGPLRLCAPGTLHATLRPHKWQGERLWVVALHGEVIGGENKFGALKREILGEVKIASE
jgi:hypothetical protein